MHSAADRRGQQGQFAPGPQCEGGPKRCCKQDPVHYSHPILGPLSISSKPAFWLRAYAADANFNIAHLTTAHPLTRAPYVVLFDLKPRNEDSNWQVCMYCM